MPFVDKAHRENPDENIPGDRCFLHYKWMVEKWRAEPRWTTADEIYAKVMTLDQPTEQWQRSKELAFMVFFQLHLMPYEQSKRKLNGDI